MDHFPAAKCPYCAYPTPGATCCEALPLAAPQDERKSCRAVLCSRSTSRITHPGNHGNHGTVHVTPGNNYVHMAVICAVVRKKKKPGDLPSL